METVIIKYGGSFVIPNETYDLNALEDLASLVQKHSDKQFVFVIGGGMLCRNINSATESLLDDALGKDSSLKGIAFDELGIATTKINGRFVLQWLTNKLSKDLVFDDIVDFPEVAPKTTKRVIIATGYKPGVSSDYDMILLAKVYGTSKAFKISNFPVVLDVKPQDFSKEKINEYKPLPLISWSALLDLVGREFIPGGNYPLDPPSAILGNELIKSIPDFTLFIGQKEQINDMLSNNIFIGTIVRN
jgi:uridylate kinase